MHKRLWALSPVCFSVPAFWRDILYSFNRSASLPCRYCSWDDVRRLADCQDDGPESGKTKTGGRLLRRIQRAAEFDNFNLLRHSGQHTHTITGAIMGVGSLRRLSAVRWGVAADSLGMDINHSGFRSDSSADLQISRTFFFEPSVVNHPIKISVDC